MTDCEPIIVRARDGTNIDASEWKSQEAIDVAHKNPYVLAMWDKFFAICIAFRLGPFLKPNKCSGISSHSD